MNRLATHTKLLFLLLWIVSLFVVLLPAQAQGQNLLTNPGFEGSFTPYTDATPARQVAQGWVPWYVGGGQSASENIYPEYYPASDVTNGLGVPRIRSGNEAQQYFTFFATHDGGIYQRVTGITPGAQLRFSAYVYVWSSTFDELDLSEGDGGVVVQVGIDPTGGTNVESASIVWSPAASQYDAYNEYSVTANAAANAVTVFVRSTVSTPVKNNNIYVDDASLSVIGAQVPPTATIVVPTNTQPPPPTATQTLPPTATLVPAATNTPPDLGIVTATPLPPDTQTPLPPTATIEVPTATLVPAATSTLVPTFTPTFTQPPTDTTVPASATPTQEQLPPTATPGGPTLTPTVTIGGTPISNDFPGSIVHTVRAGDTVGNLATLYGSSIEAIIAVNGLNQSALIRVGQGLVIPVRLAAPATSTPTITPIVPIVPTFPPEVPPNNVIYIVQPGDTLFRLAARFNTTINTIAQLNGVTNVNLIRIGQRLVIPSGTGSIATPTPSPTTPQTYVVQPGDTLFRIALRFRVPLRQIAQTNNIFDPNRIFVGQVLVIS